MVSSLGGPTQFGLAALIAAVVVSTGCGRDGLPNMVPIRGEVVVDGQPLAQGQVVYLPKDPAHGRQANGPIKPDGTFVLTTQKGGDGAMHGEYDIVVFGYGTNPGKAARSRAETEAALKEKSKSPIPEKYSDQATSGLSDTVDEDHSGFKRIELSS
jgi:hypothetical protein